MKVEVFYFEGCPNHKPAVERVKSVMKEQGIAAKVAQVEVPDADAARAVGFLGSPTIRVNGLDIDPASRSVTGALSNWRSPPRPDEKSLEQQAV
jgi:hypothetical protein